MQGLPIRRTVVLLYPSDELTRLYSSCAEEVIHIPGARFPHTTGFWLRVWNPFHWYLGVRWLFSFLGTLQALKTAVRSLSPDAIHLNSATLVPYAPFLAPVPVILHMREWVVSGSLGIRKRMLEAISTRWIAGIIYICRDYVVNSPPGPTPHVVVLNPVQEKAAGDLPVRLMDRMVSWRAAKPEVPIAVYVGGLSYIKGAEFLARVWKQLGDGRCRLVVAGQFDAPKRARHLQFAAWVQSYMPAKQSSARIRRQWQAYKDKPDVFFAGFVPCPTELMRVADLTLVPFVEPHFARPVLEAASVGCRTLVSRIGGLECLLEDGLATQGFESDDPGSFVQAIEDILTQWASVRQPLEPVSLSDLDPVTHAKAVLAFVQETVVAGMSDGSR